MKIIVCSAVQPIVPGGGQCNKSGGRALLNRMNVGFRTDTTLLKNGKPFFVPDGVGEVRGQAYVVYRISRLGKSIERQFTSRYIDGMTIGVCFTASGIEGEPGRNMDGSSVVGDFVDIDKVAALCVNNRSYPPASGELVGEEIALLSQYVSLRQGDLLFAEPLGDEFVAEPNSDFRARVGEQTVLDFRIK